VVKCCSALYGSHPLPSSWKVPSWRRRTVLGRCVPTTVAAPASPTRARVRATRLISLRTVYPPRLAVGGIGEQQEPPQSGGVGHTGPDAAQHATALVEVHQADRDIQEPGQPQRGDVVAGSQQQPHALPIYRAKHERPGELQIQPTGP
jgi:hypothetical protein